MKSMHILAGGMVLLIAVSACSPEADKQPTSCLLYTSPSPRD